jgi:hypothetical protein
MVCVQIDDQKMAIENFLVDRSMVKIKPLSIAKLNLIGQHPNFFKVVTQKNFVQ